MTLRAIKREPRQPVVDALEEYLALAKAGSLACVGIVGLGPDGVQHRYEGDEPYLMVGALADLQYGILRDANDE
jgi:hypothetical protein